MCRGENRMFWRELKYKLLAEGNVIPETVNYWNWRPEVNTLMACKPPSFMRERLRDL